MARRINRRRFLAVTGLASVGTMLAACQPKVVEVEKIVKETVVVEQEKLVKETVVVKQEVQKEVTKVVEKVVEKQTGIKNVPRERTLILYWGGSGGTWSTAGLTNPYATGYTHQDGDAACIEGLQYYSAFADKQMPWTAESHEFNADATELTVKIRKGVEWSDGTPFTAKDVAFTLNMCLKWAPQLLNSSYFKDWVKEVQALDDYTLKVTFLKPNPRFFFDYLTFKFDTGQPIIPEHVFKDVEDPTMFTFWDQAKGWPLTTGPYNYTYFTNMQKFLDRREDWWAVKTGFAKLPEVERVLVIPMVDDAKTTQLVIQNEIDSSHLNLSSIRAAVEQNPAIITHTLRTKPFGYVDWWPQNIGFNDLEEPFKNPEMRWAFSYGTPNQLFMPSYKSLQPFYDNLKDLFEKYPTNEYNPTKSAELMTKNGYTKDNEGFWVKDGKRIEMMMGGYQWYDDICPITTELLRKQGFDVTFGHPSDWGDRVGLGKVNGFWWGHGGSVGPDPYLSCMLYHGSQVQPTGTSSWGNIWRWKNDEYSMLIDQMANYPMGSPQVMELWHKAMEIWLRELPSVPMTQWYHRIPMNTTYWAGWPTEEDPYLNGCFWHLTFPRILDRLQATKK
jgi:peptide/nickel transport system substrate-binding protein